MKLKISILSLFFVFFLSTQASAQVDRRIGTQQYKRERKHEKVDFVEQSVKYLTKELTLDDFQQAVVKTVIEEERDNITALNSAKDMTTEEKKDRARAISARIYKKVLPLLSKEQAEKYTKMEEEKKF